MQPYSIPFDKEHKSWETYVEVFGNLGLPRHTYCYGKHLKNWSRTEGNFPDSSKIERNLIVVSSLLFNLLCITRNCVWFQDKNKNCTNNRITFVSTKNWNIFPGVMFPRNFEKLFPDQLFFSSGKHNLHMRKISGKSLS